MTVQVKNSNLVYVKFKKSVIPKMKENKIFSRAFLGGTTYVPDSLCVFILCLVIAGPHNQESLNPTS